MPRLIALLILIIDVLAIVDVWQRERSTEKKLLWTVVIILLPIVGPIGWYLISRKVINL